MKVLALVATLSLAVFAMPAQDNPSSPGPPGVTVISASWHKEVRNPELSADPIAANQRGSSNTSQKDADQGSNHLPVNRLLIPDSLKDPKAKSSNDPSVRYVYELKLLNNGTRTIHGLVWDFDLIESDTGREVGHHRFTSTNTIRAGKSAKLVERSALNPVSVVDVKEASTQTGPMYTTRVAITRIEYEQGEPWVIRPNSP